MVRDEIELDQLLWTDGTQDQRVALYTQFVQISPDAEAENIPDYIELLKKLLPRKPSHESSQQSFTTDDAVIRAFHRNQKEGRDVTSPVYEKITSFFRRFDSAEHFAPYISIV